MLSPFFWHQCTLSYLVSRMLIYNLNRVFYVWCSEILVWSEIRNNTIFSFSLCRMKCTSFCKLIQKQAAVLKNYSAKWQRCLKSAQNINSSCNINYVLGLLLAYCYQSSPFFKWDGTSQNVPNFLLCNKYHEI